ncbi:uncharacterized protein LOC126743448 [Anthonomus grandis grandis]|uniref:uncharacterized protein LOC126743448 n=1 Tax=Anthonomus grandis grandis TaxID=2921223 RepID=UPI0021658BF5|nr:uncharacterized protein LOC126743448 [Anthonomus grandis grandis]XP_050306508.1 uncharacterized protein LOC126743448 [Anthonomus grandis grandis]XP_050306509.1 uncharacterized protein LOC126743448 [Anthonomus grandis grandis]
MMCRLCLGEYPLNKLKNIFAYQPENCEESLVHILFWMFSVEVDVIDPYPKEACGKCLVLINHVLQIRATFQTTQDVLHGKQPKSDTTEPKQTLSEIRNTNLDDNVQKPKGKYDIEQLDNISLSTVKVSLNNLKVICPVTLDLPKFENSPEFGAYKHLGFGKYKKRTNKIVPTPRCIELSTQTSCEKLRSEMVSRGVNTDLIIPSAIERMSGVPVADHFENKLHGNASQIRSRCSVMDLLEIATHISSILTNNRLPVQDVGTNTDIPFSVPNDKLIKVDSDTLSHFSLGVFMEPLEDLLIRENYTEVQKNCFVQNYKEGFCERREEEGGEECEVDPLVEENQKVLREWKKRRLLNYYNNFRSFAVRELIEGKSIRENIRQDRDELLVKVAEVQSVYLCNFCSTNFPSNVALRSHINKVHVKNNDNKHKCNWCFRRYKNLKLLNIHESNMHKEQFGLRKDLNDTRGKEVKGFYAHMKKVHLISKKVIKCQVCGLFFKSEATFVCHMSMEHDQTEEAVARRHDRRTRGRTVNVKDIMKNFRYKWSIKKKKRKRVKEDNNDDFIWNKKDLGKYSAVSFYKNYVDKEMSPEKDSETHQSPLFDQKADVALDETIRKLSERLVDPLVASSNSATL